MIICSDKVYFPGSYFSDSNIVASAQKLKINYVLDHMPGVHIPIAKQIVSQADINDIVFAKRFQLLLPLEVEPLYLIEQIGFFECVHISGNRLRCRLALLCSILQHLFRDECVADRR